MRTLAIDCATEACSAALFERDSLVAGTFEVIGRGHGTALALLPDARRFPLLPTALLDSALAPLYGRAPDAKLPGAAG